MAKSSRVIDGLKTNTSYSFSVRAKNIAGVWSQPSTPVSIVTLRDTSAPSVPGSPTITLKPPFFLFNWSTVTNVDMRGGGYRIYVWTSNTPASALLIKEVGYTTEWAIIAIGERSNDGTLTITAGTTYWWWITAIDASGNETSRTAFSPASASVTEAVVDRGDPSAEDFTTFVTDGTWRTLDCSTIVPSGVRFIIFKVVIEDDAADSIFRLRRNGNSDEVNIAELRTQVADVPFSAQVTVACDDSRVIQYWASDVTWTSITVSVMGWIF